MKDIQKKAMLIVVDGMRPDAVEKCGHPFAGKLKEIGAYTLGAASVMPSVTLPCHFSIFHSVKPDRHGVLTNYYTPQVRPVNGICEKLADAGKRCAFFHTWEPLRDVSRPFSLYFNYFVKHDLMAQTENPDDTVTAEALRFLSDGKYGADFAFVYLGHTDVTGHKFGWMSAEQLGCVRNAFDRVQRLYEKFGDEYVFILTADHGGHDRIHGTDAPEDMTVPLFVFGGGVRAGRLSGGAGLLDIAPTVARIVGCAPDGEWEGKSLLR